MTYGQPSSRWAPSLGCFNPPGKSPQRDLYRALPAMQVQSAEATSHTNDICPISLPTVCYFKTTFPCPHSLFPRLHTSSFPSPETSTRQFLKLPSHPQPNHTTWIAGHQPPRIEQRTLLRHHTGPHRHTSARKFFIPLKRTLSEREFEYTTLALTIRRHASLLLSTNPRLQQLNGIGRVQPTVRP